MRAISKYSIDSALKEIDLDDYYNTSDELVNKRISQIKEKNIYTKKKGADYLLYRGWGSYLVYEKLKNTYKKSLFTSFKKAFFLKILMCISNGFFVFPIHPFLSSNTSH